MDGFGKSLEELIRKSAEIVTLEDELRKISKEHKEDTPEFRKKTEELKDLLDFEYELLYKIGVEGLHEISNRITNKYQEKAEKAEANNAAGKDPLDGIDPNLGTPLERLDLIIGDIIENEEEDYVQCFNDEDDKETEDDSEELDDDYDYEDDEPEAEYDEETLERLGKEADELDETANNLPETSEQDKALTENYTSHRLIDKHEKQYYKYMVIRSTIIAFQKLYQTIVLTPASDETEQKYKNDLLEFLQEFKYIVFLKTPQLERAIIEHNFDIAAIPVPPIPKDEVPELRHNLCMSKISDLYKVRADTIDI